MNCQVVQNKILAEPDPRLLPERLRLHVAGCEECRAWAAQAARLEALLERMPAPSAPSGKKAALVGKLERGEPIITRPVAAPAVPSSQRVSPMVLLVEFVRNNARRHWRPRGGCAGRLGRLGAVPAKRPEARDGRDPRRPVP